MLRSANRFYRHLLLVAGLILVFGTVAHSVQAAGLCGKVAIAAASMDMAQADGCGACDPGADDDGTGGGGGMAAECSLLMCGGAGVALPPVRVSASQPPAAQRPTPAPTAAAPGRSLSPDPYPPRRTTLG